MVFGCEKKRQPQDNTLFERKKETKVAQTLPYMHTSMKDIYTSEKVKIHIQAQGSGEGMHGYIYIYSQKRKK